MTPIIKQLESIANGDPWKVRGRLRDYIEELKIEANKTKELELK